MERRGDCLLVNHATALGAAYFDLRNITIAAKAPHSALVTNSGLEVSSRPKHKWLLRAGCPARQTT